MSGFPGELFLDFDVPKDIKEKRTTQIYERGTKRLVGTAEFEEDGSVGLYVTRDAYQKIMVNSIEDIGRRLTDRSYRLGFTNLEGNKEEGVRVHRI